MTDAIRFLLNDRPVELRDVDPTTTVLNWLRGEAALRGTKEGCAEGDCGACTVVLAEPVGDRLAYRAVNACIQFVPTLDGKALITVEGLAAPDGALHPAQQALVDAHGSQCGFCTPGFVMSLFALYHDETAPDRARILDGLAGNLCRCTGYRPIVEAGERMRALADRPDAFDRREAETLERLAALRRDRMLDYRAAGKRFLAPVTVDELAEAVEAHPDALLLAGGTDVGLWVTKQHRTLPAVIHVGGVADLHAVEERDGCLVVGAAATYAEAFQALGRHFPDLGAMLRRLGSVQIRNAGTIGGNIANGSPIGDSMPALIALGAELVLRRGAARRTMPLEDFFLGYRQTALQPGEFVAAIAVPLPLPDQRFRVHKIAKRFDQDISAVLGAFRITVKDGVVAEARIAFGGMAATPKRATLCEQALTGRRWDEAAVAAGREALAQDYAPISDMRASAAYRRLVAQNLLEKVFHETSGAEGTRVLDLTG